MRTSYDRDANALYVTLTDESVATTQQLSAGVLVDIDEHDQPVGIEVLEPQTTWLPGVLEMFGEAMRPMDVTLLRSLYPAAFVQPAQGRLTSASEAHVEISTESLEYA